jgi:hypothetical protein
LRKRFCDDGLIQGHEKNGAVAVALFEIDGDGDDDGVREPRKLR